jgi:hypothetical protein
MRIMTNHPVWALGDLPGPWTRSGTTLGTYGRGGRGYNPIEIGQSSGFAAWWDDPCNKTLILAAALSAVGSALVTYQLRKKKPKGARA